MPPSAPSGPPDADARRFPRLAAYLRDLPAGLSSYPAAMTKASLYRQALEDKPLAPASTYLPPELADLAVRPRLVSTWVPAVHVQALYLALADWHALSLREFARFSRESNRKLLSGPLYRMLAAVASPTVLLQGASMKWSSMHRGTTLDVTRTPTGADVRMTYPANLYVAMNLAGFAGGFEAILELSRAHDVSVEVLAIAPTTARFAAMWS